MAASEAAVPGKRAREGGLPQPLGDKRPRTEEGDAPERPERDVAGELALELEASLTALDTRKGPAKAYLESWAQQGTKGADGKVVAWKFQKLMQVWLIDNMYDPLMVDDATFDLLEPYMAGLKGAAKHRVLATARQILEHGADQAPASARQGFMKRWSDAEEVFAQAAPAAGADDGAGEEEGDATSGPPRPAVPEAFHEAPKASSVRARAQRIAAVLA